MPTLYYRVEAPGVNILKTVTDEVVAGLLDELDLTKAFNDAVYTMSSFMAASQYNNKDDTPTLIKNRCDVEIKYVMDKSQVPWPVETPYTTPAYGIRSSTKGNHTPVLIDEKAQILIEHQTVACALDMDFVLTFATFDEACKAFDTIQTRYKGSLIQTPFDLSFSYPVSMGLLEFLTSVYKAKTDYQNKEFLDYINDMKKIQISFDVRKSQLLSSNADKELMIRCQQLNCLAQLTMDQKDPEVSLIDNLPDTYSVSFNLMIQFGRPNLIAVHTPISVDNTLLPYALFETIVTNFHYSPYVTGVYQDLMCNEFMKRSAGNYGAAQEIVRLPLYDDWFCVDNQYVFYEYRPFLIAHFTLDGPSTTINLKQLDTIVLHPVVQAILAETGNASFDYGGLFNIGVYAGDLRLGKELVSIDNNLNLTILSNRPDKVYHLVLSETTSLKRTDAVWDKLLVKYRYFFPLTIERNLQTLVKKNYFHVSYDNSFLSFVSKLSGSGRLKAILSKLVENGEDTNQIYSYTQNPSQIADYLSNTQSARKDYKLPDGDDPTSELVKNYYQTKASIEGRSLFVAFVEQCLIAGYISLDAVPAQFIQPDQTVYPYYNGQGGYYGFNTPLRIINTTIDVTKHPN